MCILKAYTHIIFLDPKFHCFMLTKFFVKLGQQLCVVWKKMLQMQVHSAKSVVFAILFHLGTLCSFSKLLLYFLPRSTI